MVLSVQAHVSACIFDLLMNTGLGLVVGCGPQGGRGAGGARVGPGGRAPGRGPQGAGPRARCGSGPDIFDHKKGIFDHKRVIFDHKKTIIDHKRLIIDHKVHFTMYIYIGL